MTDTKPSIANLELKQQQHERPKSLKHKSKNNKRPSPTSASTASISNHDTINTVTTSPTSGKKHSGGCCGDHHNHHHAHRAAPAAGEDERIRELLTSKIAELQVGGDENLETPIDLSGVYRW